MTFFLPTEAAGKAALGSDVHIIFGRSPTYCDPCEKRLMLPVLHSLPLKRLKLTMNV